MSKKMTGLEKLGFCFTFLMVSVSILCPPHSKMTCGQSTSDSWKVFMFLTPQARTFEETKWPIKLDSRADKFFISVVYFDHSPLKLRSYPSGQSVQTAHFWRKDWHHAVLVVKQVELKACQQFAAIFGSPFDWKPFQFAWPSLIGATFDHWRDRTASKEIRCTLYKSTSPWLPEFSQFATESKRTVPCSRPSRCRRTR